LSKGKQDEVDKQRKSDKNFAKLDEQVHELEKKKREVKRKMDQQTYRVEWIEQMRLKLKQKEGEERF